MPDIFDLMQVCTESLVYSGDREYTGVPSCTKVRGNNDRHCMMQWAVRENVS